MNMDKFILGCKDYVSEYINGMGIRPDWKPLHEHVFVVWSCKALQNYKALLSIDIEGEEVYWEFTYNGDKQEVYVDAYRKWNNVAIPKDDFLTIIYKNSGLGGNRGK